MGSAPSPAPAASSGMTNNVAGMLCYIPFMIGLIVSIVFLVVEPYNKNRFVRFHAFQSLFLHVALFAVSIGLSIIGAILGFVTRGFSILLMGALWPLFGLACFVLIIVLMMKAYGNQEFKVPVIGDFAAKQAGA